MALDVVALGEVLVDLVSQGTGDDDFPVLAGHPGGAPANFLAALSKFGAKTAFLGKVGDDVFGRLLLNALERTGICTEGVVVSEEVFTTLAFVTLDDRGERSFSFARKPGADTQLRFEELKLSLIDQAKVLHFGTLSLTDEPARTATRQAVDYARRERKWISFDPNLRPALWKSLEDAREAMQWGLRRADLVKISDEEVSFLFGLGPREGAEKICREWGVQLVFVTCGADGCWYQNQNASGHVDSLSGICAVDTTGAGDIFGGSALYRILQTKKAPAALTDGELRGIARFACASAGLSTTRAGGISSIFDYGEVEKALTCR